MRSYFFFTIFLFTSSVWAQTHHCNGVIQNRPCGEQAGNSKSHLDESDHAESSELLAKRQVISDFQKAIQEARKKYDIDFQGAYPQQLCLQSVTTLKTCKTEIEKFEQKLQDKIDQRLTELSQNKKTRKEGETNNTQIIVRHDYRYRHRRKENQFENEKPDIAPSPEPPTSRGNPATSKQKVVIPGR